MYQKGLQEFLQELPAEEKLIVDDPVPRDGLLTATVLEMEKRRDYRVVQFNRVQACDMPVVSNIFSSRERIAKMAGASRRDFYMKWHDAQENMVAPRVVPSGAVQEEVYTGAEVDATTLPIAVHFASDAGRYISSGIVVAKDPDTGVYNLSYHRMQLKGKNVFGISLHSRGHLWDYFRRSAEKGRDLEIAVIVGCHPAVYLAASSKLAMDRDEYALAGALLGEPLEVVKCKSVDLVGPASAEIVLEGHISATDFADEGPFGEYTGYSTSRSTRNVFYVTALSKRKKAVFLDLVPGYSNEHLLLGGAAKEAENLYLLKERFPVVEDICFPKSGCHFHAYVKIKKTAEGQARQVMTLLCGLDMYLKMIIAVDDDIDIYDEESILWALATRVQPDEHIMILPKLMCNVLDPSSHEGMSSKLLIDATLPLQKTFQQCKVAPGVQEEARLLLQHPGE